MLKIAIWLGGITAATGTEGMMIPNAVFGLGIAAIVAGCDAGSSNAGVQDCTARGIAYFKEIESWPRLSNGRDAVEVAVERCKRTTTAFP